MPVPEQIVVVPVILVGAVGAVSTVTNCVTPPVVFEQDVEPTLLTQYVVLADKLAVV